jgi:hypothetical protein
MTVPLAGAAQSANFRASSASSAETTNGDVRHNQLAEMWFYVAAKLKELVQLRLARLKLGFCECPAKQFVP